MSPRDPQLPEGTDQIITGAGSTGTTASTGSTGGSGLGGGGATTGRTGTGSLGTGSGATGSGATSSIGTTGGSASGFVAGGAGGADDTGGTARGGNGGSGVTDKLAGQVREQVQSLRSQATDRIRDYSEQGKERACGALDEVSEVIEEAAASIDEHFGSDYGEYAHRAAGAVHDFADTIRNKSLENLLDDTRSVVRKSPGIAVATAAVLGFALVRLVKTGLDDVAAARGTQGGGGEPGAGRSGGSGRSASTRAGGV